MSRKKNFIVNLAVFLGISLYCLCASIFNAHFSKIHFQLPILNIPVFIGEVLLFVCLIFLFFYWRRKENQSQWMWGWIIYGGWVFLQAAWGYHQWGPLAFRNAALFYYPFFFIIGYSFFDRNVILHPWIYRTSIVVVLLCLLTSFLNSYYFFTFLIVLVILLDRCQRKIIPVGTAVFISVISIPNFFAGSRSHLVGILAAMLFLCCVFLFWIKKGKRFYFLGMLFLLGVVLFGLRNFADPNGVATLTNPQELKRYYQENKEYIEEKKKEYRPQDLPINLYREDTKGLVPEKENAEKLQWVTDIIHNPPKEEVSQSASPTINAPSHAEPVSLPEKKVVKQPRPLGTAYCNILFRWFIWEDMIEELCSSTSNMMLGIGFGKPQRSKSIEILEWASSEWQRDGWITPHNSYLHIVYRAGIVGAFILVLMIFTFIRLLVDFFRLKSIKGILCLSILLYWMTMANFLLILEFPYSAILFWSLFGMTFAYAQELKQERTFSS